MIELRFSRLRADRERLEHPADVFIGITADLEIIGSDHVLYAEPDFPVVELAAQRAESVAAIKRALAKETQAPGEENTSV